MSTTTTTPAADSTPAASTTPPAKIESVPPDVRRRILSGDRAPTIPDPDKAKRDEDERLAAEKKAADEKQAAEKLAAEKKADKKPKAGPKLPDAPPPPAKDETKDLTEAVRKILPSITGEAPGEPKPSPEVEAELALAKFAEEQNPERYRGMGTKVQDFYADNAKLLAERARELGGARSPQYRDFLESDEYKQWIDERRPRYERGDKEKLKEAAIAQRARKEAAAEIEPKLKELERKTLEVQHAPRIESLANQVLNTVILAPREEGVDPALEGFTKDPLKFGEQHPEEAQLIAQEAQTFVDLARTVYRIEAGLEPVDVANNPRQKWIRGYMGEQNRLMREKYPTGLEMKDGKILVDAETYALPHIRANPQYRPWSTEEIVAMIASEGNATIHERLRRRREGIQKSVYTVAGSPPPPAQSGQANETADDASPEAVTSRASGGKKSPSDKKSNAARYA